MLLSRCPGCGRTLPRIGTACAHCGLGVAADPTYWTRDVIETRTLVPHGLGGLATALAAGAAVAMWSYVPNPPLAVTLGVGALTVASLVLASYFLFPWALLLLASVRRVSSWSYNTEWSGDLAHGYAQASVLLVRGKLAHATGHFTEYGQPSARRFGSKAAPLSSQRKFVRWLTSETVAGRTRVADLRNIEWKVNGPFPRRGVFSRIATLLEPERTEERKLMVAADQNNAPAENAGTAKMYSRLLAEPRPVADLWFALSRQPEKLPETELSEYELPDWAHELEAALTAEVAPLIIN